jgi:chromosome segregation ATPase
MDVKIYSHQSSPDYVNSIITINGRSKIFEGEPSQVREAMEEYLQNFYFEQIQEDRKPKYDTSHMNYQEKVQYRDLINRRITLKGDLSHYATQIDRLEHKVNKLIDHHEDLEDELQAVEEDLQSLLNPKQHNEPQMHQMQEVVSDKNTESVVEEITDKFIYNAIRNFINGR